MPGPEVIIVTEKRSLLLFGLLLRSLNAKTTYSTIRRHVNCCLQTLMLHQRPTGKYKKRVKFTWSRQWTEFNSINRVRRWTNERMFTADRQKQHVWLTPSVTFTVCTHLYTESSERLKHSQPRCQLIISAYTLRQTTTARSGKKEVEERKRRGGSHQRRGEVREMKGRGSGYRPKRVSTSIPSLCCISDVFWSN